MLRINVIVAIFIVLFYLTPKIFAQYSAYVNDAPNQLKVATFNIWISGDNVENGLAKIAKAIIDINADVIALQEVQNSTIVYTLVQMLNGYNYSAVYNDKPYPDTAIFTKHKFVLQKTTQLKWGIGVPIKIPEKNLLFNFFCMHLNYKSYGPYAANNKMVTDYKQILIGEDSADGTGRAANIRELLNNPYLLESKKLARTHSIPLFVVGDFNSPSHLDWIQETRAEHGGWAFEWPATKLLFDAGFIDSFRQVYPDPLKYKGHTWSTVQKSVGPEWDWMIPEPQDRLDFIFYDGYSPVVPFSSFVYAGTSPTNPKPYHYKNEWPSDHYALITHFRYI